jgi:hypothetical protein
MQRCTTVKAMVAAVILALVTSIALTPQARADGLLAVGMEIDIGSHSCSLGFFAFNQAQNRLAVDRGPLR